MRKKSDNELANELELLRHGGPEALIRFTDVARALLIKGGPEHVKYWVSVAVPALPETERNEIITFLMLFMLGDRETGVDTPDENPNFH